MGPKKRWAAWVETFAWLEWVWDVFLKRYYQKFCKIYTQQTLQLRFNIVFTLIWRRNVAQRQINVETTLLRQRWNNVVYFNVELNNVRQHQNNVVIFNVNFDNIGQRRNNVANIRIWKKKSRFKNKKLFSFKEYTGLKIFFNFSPVLRGVVKEHL